ncbi:DUF6603 domain-containing protein [Paenibacillus caui]|uniref:DUF6603 domain-containing protein n=1 Tax=Paenibacillus caui TaxID=2873927 RepID=UPI001CAA21DA|nr:DUF6603 domain-containing protein [Paenibacillus caui]
MSLDLNTYHSIISSALQNNAYTLDISRLQSEALTKQASLYFPNNVISLSAASAEAPGEQAIYSVLGTNASPPWAGARIRLDFYFKLEQPQLCLTASLPGTWKLTDSFPEMAGNAFAALSFASSPSAKFVLLLDPNGPETPALAFSAVLDASQMTGGLSSLLHVEAMPLTGSIGLDKGGAEVNTFAITGPVIPNISLGIGSIDKLSVTVGCNFVYRVFQGTYIPFPFMYLSGSIPFHYSQDGKEVQGELPLSVEIFDFESDYRFSADLTDALSATEAQMASLLNGISPVSLLPSGLKLENMLQVRDFFVDLNPSDSPLVARVGIDIESAASWTILHLDASNQDLSVKNLRFSFRLSDPFGAKNPWIGLSGTLELGKSGGLHIAAGFRPNDSSYTVQGTLAEGKPLFFQEIVAAFIGEDDAIPPIELTQLSFLLSDQAYHLEFQLDDVWTFSHIPIAIEEIGCLLDHQPDGITLKLNAVIHFAGLELDLGADYDSSQKSWTFKAYTIESAVLGTILDGIENLFNVKAEFPDYIRSLMIDRLDIEFTTSGQFTFLIAAQFPVTDSGDTVSFSFQADLEYDGTTGYSGSVSSSINISLNQSNSSLAFEVDFVEMAEQKLFIGEYTSSQTASISIHDLVGCISCELAAPIPESLNVELQDAKFVYYEDQTGPNFLFGLGLGSALNLSNLPLVGKELPVEDTVCVQNLQIVFAKAAFTQAQAGLINPHFKGSVKPLPAGGVAARLSFGAELLLGSAKQTVSLEMDSPAIQGGGAVDDAEFAGLLTGLHSATAAGDFAAESAASAASNAKWINVQKSYGPVTFNRIGISYANSSLWFLLDGQLAFSGLTITLTGMGIGSPLASFRPEFQLTGLGIEYNQSPIEIGGSFAEVLPPPDGTAFMYEGDAVLRAASFSLSALGSYAQMNDGEPSMFIFAQLEEPLGGPPALFITGLSAGFGYNRTLAVPKPDDVFAFPLLALTSDSGPKPAMADVLQQLEGRKDYAPGKRKAWITPSIGEYWLGVGVEFWSFELLHTRALLIGKFGRELALALLGLSSVRLPQAGDEIYAYIELELEADWKPAEGFFGLTAMLTPKSFVLDPQCRLTGGFAFYLWYEGEREGQFVITLGGYHPSFTAPDYYPSVPRLGLHWAVSDKVSIGGDLYFALTPGAVMAGGGLQVLFHDGDLKAWFTAQADMLMTFHPFHYDVDISISIGVSYRVDFWFVSKTFSVELGASLVLWGPSTGGTAHIHWWVISFSVSFGADRSNQNRTPIAWSEFKRLLPDLSTVCGIVANTGVAGSAKDENGETVWLVRTDRFQFSTQTAIPAGCFTHGSANQSVPDPLHPGGYTTQIRPMNLTNVDSVHRLVVWKDGTEHDVSGWSIVPYQRNMPSALWGMPLKDRSGQFVLNPQVPSSDTVQDVPSGLMVTPPEPALGTSNGELSAELLAYDELAPDGPLPLLPDSQPSNEYEPIAAADTPDAIAEIMQEAAANRTAIYNVLSAWMVYDGTNDTLDLLAGSAESLYANSPMVLNRQGGAER